MFGDFDLVAVAALAGVVIGLGLAVGANVSGVVLAFYGLLLGAILAALFVIARRRSSS